MLSSQHSPARAAPQGMEAAHSRSLAGVAVADADSYLLPPAVLLWHGLVRTRTRSWSRCPSWSWRPASSPAALPGLPSRAKTPPISSPPRRCRETRSYARNSKRCWVRSHWCSCLFIAALALLSPSGAIIVSSASWRPPQRHPDPALVSQPGTSRRFPAPPNLIPYRNFRGSVLVYRMGCRSRASDNLDMACVDRCGDGRRHPARSASICRSAANPCRTVLICNCTGIFPTAI